MGAGGRRDWVACLLLVALSEQRSEWPGTASGPAAWHAGTRAPERRPPALAPLLRLERSRPVLLLRLAGGGGGQGARGAESWDSRELSHESQDAYGRHGSAVAPDPQSASTSSEYEDVPWAERETTFRKMRREEEGRLVSEFGGDLSVLPKGQHGLRRRLYDDTANTTLVSHAARKRREEAASVKAAGGNLDSVLGGKQKKLNAFQRDMLEWQAAGQDRGYISAQERRRHQEEVAAIAFGENKPAVAISDKIKSRQQEWDMQQGNTCEAFVPAKERKKRTEERAAQEFGGELGSCTTKHLSALEREKLNSPFRRKKKK